MSRAGSSALIALSLLAQAAARAPAQDTAAVPTRELPVDTARVRPFHRAYDMFLHRADSTLAIGARDIDLQATTYAGNAVWLLTELRTGAVPAYDSLYLGLDLRPLHYSSAQGLARLALEFVGDSVYGAVTTPASKQNVVIDGRHDLLVSAPFADLVLGAIPLAAGWADSVAILSIDASAHALDSATISVVGEEALSVDSTTTPVFVVALRADAAHTVYWVSKIDGSVVRELQSVPSHVGAALEYRARPATVPQSPP